MKINTVSVFFLCFIKRWNKDYNNNSYFHKIYSGEKLEHDLFFKIHNHKILYYFNWETKSKFLTLKYFPSAQHDNIVLNSNVITDHRYIAFITNLLKVLYEIH